MKSFILVGAGIFALAILGLLVGCALSVSMRVVTALRSRPDRKASLAQELIAGENRARRREMPPGG